MNLCRLVVRPWILVIIAFVILNVLLLLPSGSDGFVNYPQQVDPTAKPISNETEASADATTANNNYAAILMFIRENPTQAVGFINDIKRKFFNESCTVRSDIDLVNLVNFSDGIPFR